MTYETYNSTNQTEKIELSFDFDSMEMPASTTKKWEREEIAKNKKIVAKKIRSQVMKRAYKIFKVNNENVSWSNCLKASWFVQKYDKGIFSVKYYRDTEDFNIVRSKYFSMLPINKYFSKQQMTQLVLDLLGHHETIEYSFIACK